MLHSNYYTHAQQTSDMKRASMLYWFISYQLRSNLVYTLKVRYEINNRNKHGYYLKWERIHAGVCDRRDVRVILVNKLQRTKKKLL